MIRSRYIVWLIVVLFAININGSKAQHKIKTPEERQLLKEAEKSFFNGQFEEALPSFLKLHTMDSTNSIYNFSIGIIYLNSSSDKTKAIHYLEKTSNDSSSELYHYVNFYLGEAYKLVGRCDDATKSFEKYKTSLKKTDPKINTIDSLIASCKNGAKAPSINNAIPGQKLDAELSSLVDSARISSVETASPPISSIIAKKDSTLKVESPVKETTAIAKEEEKIKPENKMLKGPTNIDSTPDTSNKTLHDSQNLPAEFYSIQIGNFKKPVTEKFYIDLKDQYKMDQPDHIKYFSGVYKKKELASSYLKEIQKKGHKDAFIVHINTGMKLTAVNSSDAPDKIKLNSGNNSGNYTVQIGTFKNKVPIKIAVQFMSVKNVLFNKSADGLTKYTVGSYSDRTQAEEFKKAMYEKGFKTAFVIEVPLKKD